MIETITKDEMKKIKGGTDESIGGLDGEIPKCNSCSVSHPGYDCAKQMTQTGEYCMCGPKSNWWYC